MTTTAILDDWLHMFKLRVYNFICVLSEEKRKFEQSIRRHNYNLILFYRGHKNKK
jgi:uncharacterized membrane protein